ncbi:MAG: DUF4339 domain-containing protein [Planctomycetaceae bacterium]|jgi:hypothetical protein|nr:DUF4339 domain-containing protein [Planctomycetaceae bacterium]
MLYFYDKKGTKIGPIHIESLKKLIETKKINPDTIITNEKGKKWKAREMPELKFNELEFFTINILRKMVPHHKKRTENNTSIENKTQTYNNIVNKIPEQNTNAPKQTQVTEHLTINDKIHDITYNSLSYKYIYRTKIICNVLSIFFLYGGITGTLISFLLLIQYTNYSYLILVAGLFVTVFLWHITGLYSDLLTWKINIANDLNKIKSRSIQDE